MKPLVILTAIFMCAFSAYAEPDVFGRTFSNGAPPCTACHSVAAAGYTDSAWGPDISSLYFDMGEDAQSVAEFVKESGIAPMDAVYADTGLKDEELILMAEAYAGLNPEKASVTGGNRVTAYAFIFFLALLGLGRLMFRKNGRLEENG